MKPANRTVTNATAWDWYQRRYEKCLECYGPDSLVTQGYKVVLDRIDEDIIEEMTLKVHYASEHSRPLDISV